MARNPTPITTMRDVLAGRYVPDQILGRRFGIEVEAERLEATEYDRLRAGVPFEHDALRNLRGTWNVTLDGSLRHNGVEFVSAVLRPEAVQPALEGLWPVFTENLVRTNVRAGIHVHVNSGHLTPEDFVAQLQSYVLLEPLLFQLAGDAREQNIYCVPWYLTNDELARVRRVCEFAIARKTLNLRAALDITCKYSAMYLGPMLRFGTVEFRHAPTWPRLRDVSQWTRLVAAAVDVRLDLADESSVRTLPDLLPDVGLDYERYYADVERRGLYARARSLLPCTYKARPWGVPAGLAFPASPAAAAAPVAQPEVRVGRLRNGTIGTLRQAQPATIQWEEVGDHEPDFDTLLRQIEVRQAQLAEELRANQSEEG